MPLIFFFFCVCVLKLPFKIGSSEGHLSMASAIETSNASCNNNAFIVYEAKLQAVEIQMFFWKGDHIRALFTLPLTPEMPATAAQLLLFWHRDKLDQIYHW